MFRFLTLFLIAYLCLTACRKDQLTPAAATRLTAHTTHQLNRVFFASDSLCFAVGGERYTHATILRSTDGGFHWQAIDIPDAGKILNDICKSPAGVLYACGIDGRLVRSEDDGLTWSFHQIPDWKSYKAIAFPASDSGIVMGGISFYNGIVNRFDGEGQAGMGDSIPQEINRLKFVNATTGFAAGYGVVLKTSDGGATWQELPGVTGDNFKSIATVGMSVWVCGYNGSVYHSPDLGQNWQCLRNGNDPTLKKYRLYDIAMRNQHEGFCVGENGIVLYTDDGGQHWMEVKPFTKTHLRGVALCPDGSLLICGEQGALWRVNAF